MKKMTRVQWGAVVVTWAALMAVLLRVSDGSPITGTAAAVGLALLVANARGLARGQPAPLFGEASVAGEVVLGGALVGLAVFGALGQTIWFLASLLVAVSAAVFLIWRQHKRR
jgi:hypothetical protein